MIVQATKVEDITVSVQMTTTAHWESGIAGWESYMPSIYRSRQGPQPLGTVVFEEIEAKAEEKLKDYPGKYHRLRPKTKIAQQSTFH